MEPRIKITPDRDIAQKEKQYSIREITFFIIALVIAIIITIAIQSNKDTKADVATSAADEIIAFADEYIAKTEDYENALPMYLRAQKICLNNGSETTLSKKIKNTEAKVQFIKEENKRLSNFLINAESLELESLSLVKKGDLKDVEEALSGFKRIISAIEQEKTKFTIRKNIEKLNNLHLNTSRIKNTFTELHKHMFEASQSSDSMKQDIQRAKQIIAMTMAQSKISFLLSNNDFNKSEETLKRYAIYNNSEWFRKLSGKIETSKTLLNLIASSGNKYKGVIILIAPTNFAIKINKITDGTAEVQSNNTTYNIDIKNLTPKNIFDIVTAREMTDNISKALKGYLEACSETDLSSSL